MTFRAPKGTDDIFPPASLRWRRVLRLWEDITERWGYDLVLTPLFEHTAIFARTMGEATEIVGKQMYTFEDKGGRSLTLRPEGTAPVVRAYLQAGSGGVQKLAYSGPMFRYEQPQAARRRQFYQVGLEYLGEADPGADVEVVELAHRFLQEAGVGEMALELNTLGDAASRRQYRDVLFSYLEGIADDLCSDCQARRLTNPLRVLDCKVDGPRLTDAPRTVDHLTAGALDHYRSVKEGLARRAISFTENPRLVRGLDYYTHTVFEYQSRRLETAHHTLGGGGRYDGLAETLGGSAIPGVGVAIGIDRVLLAAPPDGSARLEAFMVVVDPLRWEEARSLAARLRNLGLRVELAAGPRALKAQMKLADRRGARRAVLVGDGWEAGEVRVRHLGSGDEQEVKLADLPNTLAAP